MTEPIRCETEHSGQLVRIVLDRPKANVLDSEMMAAIRDRVAALARSPGPARLLVFEGAGSHFSFGASVEEHLPEKVAGLLRLFHSLFRELEASGLPTAAVVRGQCLGGGCELALWCGYVLADPSSRFGVPETRLGVFPPMATLALPWRTTGALATRLILTGESIEGPEAARLGLADLCVEDPEDALQSWFAEHLAGKSAVALRTAWRAARRPLARALSEDVPALEELYLKDLMSHRDPVEGLTAFLERRPPSWTDR